MTTTCEQVTNTYLAYASPDKEIDNRLVDCLK